MFLAAMTSKYGDDASADAKLVDRFLRSDVSAFEERDPGYALAAFDTATYART